jgi:hypothetical protein
VDDITSVPVQVASFRILCPEPDCEEPITVGVVAQLDGENLRELVLTPDLTDVWAHSWTHWGGDEER